MMLLLICILFNIDISESCQEPWCYQNAYMTVCHDEYECGLVNDMTSTSTKCSWVGPPYNGVAVRPGMFNTYCAPCDYGTYQKCSFTLPDDNMGNDRYVDAQVCNGEQKQTCYVQCGQEICIKRRDDDTGKEFYKTGRLVSSCPQNHPVNNQQCCDNQDWSYCTCLQRPTVDVSDDVYDDLGQSNNFVDVWFGGCGSQEYHATDDYAIKLINENGLSQWYYAVATRVYNPNWHVTYVGAKSANANYYYKCDQQSYDSEVWKCNDLKNAVGPMTGPISLEIYTSYTDNNGASYRYIKKEGVMTLSSNEIQMVDLYTDGSAFTEEIITGDESGLSLTEILAIIVGLLIVFGVIGVIAYCVYKRRKNKGDVSFNHDQGIDDNKNDEVEDNKEEIIVEAQMTTSGQQDD